MGTDGATLVPKIRASSQSISGLLRAYGALTVRGCAKAAGTSYNGVMVRTLVLIVAVVGSLGLIGCGDDGAAGPDAAPAQVLPACADTEGPGATSLAHVSSTLVATVSPAVSPLPEPGELNPASADGEQSYLSMGFGDWERGPGIARVQRTELGGDTAFAARTSLLYFVQLADLQLVDDESPARWGNLDNTVAGGTLRPQESFLPHAITAMNRTLAAIVDGQRGFDFGILNGDLIDNAQRNELRWLIDLMDGQSNIHVDSAADDDPAPGPNNDAKDPLDGVAFPAPWLFIFGNHDTLVLGTTALDVWAGVEVGDYSMFGTRDYTKVGAPLVTDVVPADANRVFLDRDQMISELQDTASVPGPVGHGFAAGADTSLGANYVYDPSETTRVIVLDTNDIAGGSDGLVMQATVAGFVRPELERAQTDGKLVLFATHHGADTITKKIGTGSAESPDALSGEDVQQLLASYPNVIAWLVGHNHTHRIIPVSGADAAHPGYWEIQTSALSDWPAQARIIEIVDNGNDTLSIFVTSVDYTTNSCLERRYRRLSLLDYQSGWIAERVASGAEDINVELVIPVPASAVSTLAAATGPSRIESETTLAGM